MQQWNPYYQPTTVYNPMMNAQQRLAVMEQQYPQFGQQNMLPTQMSGTTTNFLNGRIVDDFSTITADLIPMDNTGAIFIKRDGTEIQHKIWSADGTIKTTRYEPIVADLDADAGNLSKNVEKSKFDLSDESTEVFMNKFDEVLTRLDKMEKSIGVKSSGGRTKKESDSE